MATFTFPNRIRFGEGARQELASELESLGAVLPLVVTDAGVLATGWPGRILDSLDHVLFDGVQGNPTESDVLRGLSEYRDCGCDSIIAIGGGSPIDAAKAIRLLATHSGDLADYDLTTGGSARITGDLPPMIAIPTTAGTGSEAGRGALIQIPKTGRKTIVLSPHLLPSVAICDPELTYELPPGLTAATGMDALSHAVESYVATTFHPICDGIAIEALRFVARGLEGSIRQPNDPESRRSLSMGSLMAGISFHKGLGVVHSLSHALGGEGRVHHGTLNAILLPHALRFNRPAAEAKLANLAHALGLGRSGDAPGHLLALIDLLLARLPLPRRLGELEGLDRGRIGHYAELASRDHCHKTNPRPCSIPDFEAILERAW